MQVKKLVLALAVAFVAPSAFAADLSTGVTVDNIMYVTGATAQTKGIAISVGRLCGANPLITLTDGKAVPAGKGWKCDAPAGTTYANLPGVTGPFVVLKNEGGSLNAITPLRNGSTQGQLDLTNCTVTGTTGTCANALVAKPEHIGFADVSQKIFAAKGQLVAQTAGNTYVADVAVGAGQGFGVVVSPALYTLLQADQGTSGVPSISKSQYASLMTQTTGFWSNLLPNGTAHAALPLTLDRRSLTSGTQASAEVFFLSNPCAKGAVAGSASALLGSAAGTSFVDGADTLIVKQAGSSDAVIADAASTSAYVIGVVSLENAQPASSWKFVAIDGVHPGTANAPEFQKKNLVNGKYAFAYETNLFKSTKSTLGAAVLNNINDFSNAFVADLGVGANLATSNGLFGDPLAPAADFGTDTSHYSRSGNECAPAVWQY
jgi:hypothetical protein